MHGTPCFMLHVVETKAAGAKMAKLPTMFTGKTTIKEIVFLTPTFPSLNPLIKLPNLFLIFFLVQRGLNCGVIYRPLKDSLF